MAKMKNDQESRVTDVEFFNEDLDAFDDSIQKTEQLYTKVEKVFDELTGGETIGYKLIGVSAEVARTLSTVRVAATDAVAKRFSAKKDIATLVMKKKQGEEETTNMESFAREMLGAIRAQPNVTIQANGKSTPEMSERERAALDARIDAELRDNTIKFTKNDAVMKDAFRGVEVCWSKKKRTFVAITRNGNVIDDYPQARVGDKNIVREEDGFAIGSGGTRYRVV
jgi:hypothetical protein